MNYQKMFNDKFCDFLKDLCQVFPEDKDFKLALSGVKLGLLADVKSVHTVFHETVVIPYSKQIMDKDEAFFLEKSYEGEFVDNGIDSMVDIVDKLKSYWKNLSDSNRTTVWKYLQLLTTLSGKLV